MNIIPQIIRIILIVIAACSVIMALGLLRMFVSTKEKIALALGGGMFGAAVLLFGIAAIVGSIA